jgi:Putative porin
MVINSTTDIVNALVSKGVLTEEEGALLTKGRTEEAAGQAKALKKASKLKVSDAIDSATIYGDVRVRAEQRESTSALTNAIPAVGSAHDYTNTKSRFKVTMGVKTEAGDWYGDLAFATGADGRSDNANFGIVTQASGKANQKATVYVKRAMVGYKATDWLTVEAGRMENPLYTTPMIYDADLNPEGLVEKFKFKAGDANIFVTGVQAQYLGVRATTDNNITTATLGTSELIATQVGVQYPISDKASAKVAGTYTFYTKNINASNFGPALMSGVNDLDLYEIPAEINYMLADNLGMRVYGDYAWNSSADNRAKNSGLGLTGSSGSDDKAWLVGAVIGSTKNLQAFEGNKMAKGDWLARLWYQEVGAWAVDPNMVDSDFMESRVNMSGTVFKGTFLAQDNVAINLAYGHGQKKNNSFYTFGYGDQTGDVKKLDLLQLDLTYKF